MMKTKTPKAKEIQREWHLFDAEKEILGRLSTRVACLLMGKNKTYFIRHLDCGDYVVVLNAAKVAVTGAKEKEKMYYRHSGFPKGLRAVSLGEMREKFPERIIIHAVSGMLPDNKLKASMLRRLFVFAGKEHPYKDKVFVSSAYQDKFKKDEKN